MLQLHSSDISATASENPFILHSFSLPGKSALGTTEHVRSVTYYLVRMKAHYRETSFQSCCRAGTAFAPAFRRSFEWSKKGRAGWEFQEISDEIKTPWKGVGLKISEPTCWIVPYSSWEEELFKPLFDSLLLCGQPCLSSMCAQQKNIKEHKRLGSMAISFSSRTENCAERLCLKLH